MKNKFGVPCSLIKDKIDDVEINCTSEQEAMALAAGAYFAGQKPVVYMQDTGLMNCLCIILSLFKPYEIPLPYLVLSIRHIPHHHHFIGKITRKLLKLIKYDGEIEIVEKES